MSTNRNLSAVLRALWLILPLALIPAAASADCRNGGFPVDGKALGLAKVVHAPRTYFRTDTPPCPNDTSTCRDHTYVVPGDIVLTGDTVGNYVCAVFPNRVGGSAGYIGADELAAIPQPRTLPLAAWAGTWADGDDTLALKVRGGKLAVDGEAFWPSRNPPKDLFPGGGHDGAVAGTALPVDRSLVVREADDECEVRATLLPPFLIVHDNNECGGVNVSFRGIYRRR